MMARQPETCSVIRNVHIHSAVVFDGTSYTPLQPFLLRSVQSTEAL
jgi:hypothetical protein